MNGKKVACLILIMIIAGVAYGTQMMQQKASGMKLEQETAKGAFTLAETEAVKAEMLLKKRTDETAESRQFLASWSPVVNRFQSGQEAEQAVMNSVRNASLLALSQKFEVRDNKSNPLVPKSLLGTLVIQDEFAKTLNWLGDIERKIPVARVTSCRLKQGDGGNQINLEVHIEVPLINLQAEIEGPAKKS